METNFPLNFSKYICEFCNIKTSNKKDYNKHILTAKHKKLTSVNKMETIFPQNNENKFIYKCINCNKIYNSRVGIWKHKKKCNFKIEQNKKPVLQENNDHQLKDGLNMKDKDSLLLHLLKKNEELQNKIIEMSSTSTINNNNNCLITTNNAFNLNFFLNETCKDAMNITDFVSSIKLSLEDLENTGRRGYIEGISNIIIKNLNNLEQHMRPLHCSDLKREVLYIKDNNEWTKESSDKPILTKAVKTIANENIKQIKNWREKNPDCTDSDSKKNNLYLKIVSNSMNGITKEEGEKNINKIISNVAKETVIQKNKI